MSKILDELNPAQREAVTHTTGPLLIIAGPGSGKTRTVVHSIAYAIEVLKVVPNRIAAFTFTRKAKDELKNRVSKIIENELANNIWISTFHSFCGSVVNAELKPLRIEYNQEPTVKELLRLKSERIRAEIDYIQHHRFPEPDDVLPFITPCEESNIHSLDAIEYMPDPQIADIYVDTLKKYEQLADDDSPYTRVQLLTYLLFRDVPEVKKKWQEKFDLIFVDEYQDTDQVQYQIIKDLSERHRDLRVVGDDDQGIYGWRGADIQNILNYEQDHSKPTVISLGQNYRSTRQIVNASRAIIDFNPDRREKKLFTNNPKGDKVKHLHCEDREAEASTIAGFICRAIQSGWTANDFAVLCPSTDNQAAPFEEAFANLEIPSHVSENSSDMPSNCVAIMTIHKSKGLEFPNVFVAGVCSGLLPHYNSKEENWDEALRLLYVAMTRAENWLCLSSYEKDASDKNTSFERGPSRFLDFIPQSLVERIKTLDNTAIPSRVKKGEDNGEDTEKSPKDGTSLPIRPQTVLGIDPGKENVGWSITQRLSDRYTCKYGNERPAGQPIERKINELIMEYSPDAISVEKLEGATDEWFLHVAGCVAQIRSIADQQGIECHFYSPQDVKYAVTGNKRASKGEVQQAVKQVCNLKEIPEPHHSADAIATSLCYLRNYLNYSRFQNNVRMKEHYDSGTAYLGIRQYNEAIVEFEKAINNAPMIDPMYTKAHCGLARAYIGLGKLEEAANSVKEALRLENNYPLALQVLEDIKQKYYERGMDYLKQGDLVSSENSAKEILKLDSNYQPAQELMIVIKQEYYKRGVTYIENGKYAKAINSLLKASNLDPSDKEIYTNLGRAYYWQDDYSNAASCYQKAVDIDPNDKTAYSNLGNAYYWMGAYNKAINPLQKAKDLDLNCEKIRYYLARTYFELGELEKAKQEIEKSLGIASNYQPARKFLGNLVKIEQAIPIDMILIPAVKFRIDSSDKDTSSDKKPRYLDDLDVELLSFPLSIDFEEEVITGNSLVQQRYPERRIKTMAEQKNFNLDDFYIDRCAVTNAQYLQFLNANPQWGKDRIARKYHNGYYLKHWNGNNYPYGEENRPVVYVSWYAAMAYAQWVGKRLPTEVEWEKAVHCEAFTWVSNMWEWCLDKYVDSNFHASPVRQDLTVIANKINEVINGFTSVKTPRVLRVDSSSRGQSPPCVTYYNFGFRCAKSVIP